MKQLLLAVMATVMLEGCATSSLVHDEPMEREINASRVVNLPFDEFWDRYVEDLSQSFFVVNNISKESRIINVSFTASKPSDYIDCGTSTRSWEGGLYTPAGSVTYATADPSVFYQAEPGTAWTWRIARKTDLEGRFNVYLAPRGNDTILRVKARYIWTFRWSARSMAPNGLRDSGSDTISFDSGARGELVEEDGSVLTCVSTGRLEEELLGFGS